MLQPERARTSRSWAWIVVLFALIAIRIPSIAQPAGGDQLLYSYVARHTLEGGVPYRDAFEQKPPGVFVVYAAMWGLWNDESVVAAADLAAAAAVAWLLVGLGRRLFGGRAGEAAAALFLLLGDPGIQRLSGLNVRAQCETFIALAVAGAIVTASRSQSRPVRLFLAGVLCGAAFWLKYNAAIYVIPVALAAGPGFFRSLGWIAAGAAAVTGLALAYFAGHGALTDLWLGTIGYNLQYSTETYRSAGHAVQYLLSFPVLHMRVDGLWFAGGVGAACLLLLNRTSRGAWVALAWTAAAIVSMAINGSRGLPQYFVQAAPALALCGAAGILEAWRQRRRAGAPRILWPAVVLLAAAGIWRVGIEPVPVGQPRAFGLPQAVSNLGFDLRYVTGKINRAEYLRRFERDELSKFSPASVERLAQHVRDRTRATDSIYVFGFASGGVHVKSGRPSASRFFWSRPVVLEFEGGRPRYGSAGLLADLQRAQPAIVALQKRDWGLAEANVKDSFEFFVSTPALSTWLTSGYVPDYEDPAFSVWRRRN
jgi:hypothetical protein